jgi:mitogen-activated protein kinase kinase
LKVLSTGRQYNEQAAADGAAIPNMSSPAPLLRPPIPGSARSQSGTRTPQLTLGIPSSPSVKPVGGEGQPPVPEMQPLRPSSRPTAPKLCLATPMASSVDPQAPRPSSRPTAPKLSLATMGSHADAQASRPSTRPTAPKLSLATPMGSYGALHDNLRPQMHSSNTSAATASNDPSHDTRLGGFNIGDGRGSRPESATSSTYSALSFAMGLRQGQMAPPIRRQPSAPSTLTLEVECRWSEREV